MYPSLSFTDCTAISYSTQQRHASKHIVCLRILLISFVLNNVTTYCQISIQTIVEYRNQTSYHTTRGLEIRLWRPQAQLRMSRSVLPPSLP